MLFRKLQEIEQHMLSTSLKVKKLNYEQSLDLILPELKLSHFIE